MKRCEQCGSTEWLNVYRDYSICEICERDQHNTEEYREMIKEEQRLEHARLWEAWEREKEK